MDSHYIVAAPTRTQPRPALTRRAFVRQAAVAGAALALGRRRGGAGPALSLALVGGGDDARRGALLGVDEAERGAHLFGGSITFARHDAPAASDSAPSLVADLARRSPASVLVVADAGAWDAIAGAVGSAGLLAVNVASRGAARRGACAPSCYHMIASDATRRGALAQWMSADGGQGGASSTPRDADPPATVVEWHPSLERFGAMELNARYAQRFGAPMNAEAWLAWAAVKALWETALRARSGSAPALAAALSADATQFDGHKGVPLSFQRATHQLRQPLYVVQRAADGSERVVAELPRAGAGSARDRLDAIMAAADSAALACR